MDRNGAEKAPASMTAESLDAKPDAESVAVYIASAAGELSAIAKRHNFAALSYILDMARLEAEQIARGYDDQEANRG